MSANQTPCIYIYQPIIQSVIEWNKYICLSYSIYIPNIPDVWLADTLWDYYLIKKDSTKFDLLPVYGTVRIKHITRYYNILIFLNHKLVDSPSNGLYLVQYRSISLLELRQIARWRLNIMAEHSNVQYSQSGE